MKRIVLYLLPIVALISCNENFSANGEYSPKLIVYSVLDGSVDTQYVRVYSSFSPEQYNPNSVSPKINVTGALVKVYDDSSVYIFHDTTISFVQDNGSIEQLHLYVSYFRPKEKKNYMLSVQSTGFPTATSTAIGLEASQIILFSTIELFEPASGKNITVDIYLGKNVSAYLTVFTIEYELLKDSVWQTFSREVPISIVKDAAGNITKRFYPVPEHYAITRSIDRNVKINYPTEFYLSTINDIKTEYQVEYDKKALRFKDVIFQLTQFDNDIFTYYSITNNFPGATTIRLDEPDYTNIKNGFGIYGAVAVQKKKFGIPSDFP